MSKPWGKVGAWAADAEQAEQEEKEQAAAAASSGGRDTQSFPPLKEAVNTKGKKKKMSLQEFTLQNSGSGYGSGGLALESRGLTPDEMLRLPKGPQERSGDEMQYGRMGGGFSSYGRSSGPQPGRMRDRDGDGDGNWGSNRRSYGGFDDDRRGSQSRVSEFDQPSRADEVDNWTMTKKPMGSNFDSGNRQNRYASLGSGGGNEGFSRADEVDNWLVGKKQQVSVAPPPPRSSSNFGSGFRDSSGPGPDRWPRGGGLSDDRWSRGGGGGMGDDRQRTRLVLDKPRTDGVVNETAVAKPTNKPNPFGAARPREEVLSEKGLDWRKVDVELEAKKISSRPSSAQSSRPGSAQSDRPEGVGAVQQGVTRPKVNPFGDAKPREVLLEEKGLDWKKIDLELERRHVDRSETDVEKNLKEEIAHLKTELKKESVPKESGQEQTSLHDRILQKERELEQLTRELDDKVRFVQKPIDRPGSGSGRISAIPERPPIRSGSFEDSRNIEFMERPRSRGTGDVWPRPRDDRRGFQGGRERGFMGNRYVDRSGERW